ncbi:hypothetical protein MHYP_G00234600 [Metynnis hypsauchen]
MLQRWPALFVENQVYQEFNRVVGKNLKQEFYDSLDRHCPALVDVMKSKRGLKRQLLDALLRQAQTSDIADIRCLVLRGLAVLLDDDPSEFFKDCFLCPPTSCVCIAAPPPAEEIKESREGGGIKYHV